MQYKGFSNSPQQLLIKGWLLPENRTYYKFKTNAFVLESLPMMLNMWVAISSGRFVLLSKGEQTVVHTLSLITTLDLELTQKNKSQLVKWLKELKTNDQFYIDYYKRLLQLVKTAITQGKYSELNGCIQNTWEYKQWMEEAGYLSATPNLKDGWLHPLSEFTSINGEEVMNFWAVASVLSAAATGRCDCGDQQKSITRLIQLGVLDVQTDINLRLQVASILDAEYLEIVSQTKEALDTSVKK
jgi:hypothetical protein